MTALITIISVVAYLLVGALVVKLVLSYDDGELPLDEVLLVMTIWPLYGTIFCFYLLIQWSSKPFKKKGEK